MSRRNILVWAAGLSMAAAGIAPAPAQDYPSRTVRIVTGAAGGSGDLTSRLIAQGLTTTLGQQVIVENRGGAGGAIAIDLVKQAAPDGHTLLLYSSNVWTLPLLKQVNYDPLRDFAPVSLTARSPNILVVHPSLPVQSVKELIALAKARPGQLNYGASGHGSSPHIAAELFNAMADVKITSIIYKGGAQALNSLMAGELQVMFATAASVTSHIKSNRLKALAVSSQEPSALYPGLPTVAASGLPGYESVSMSGMFAPAATPDAIVNRLNEEVVRVLEQKEVRERFLSTGVEPLGSTRSRLTDVMKSEMSRLGKIIKNANIRS